MSTLKATNLQHPSAASPNVVMGSTGSVAVAGALTGAGMDLVNKTDFSAVSSVSLNNVFTSTYDNYKILVSGVVASTNTTIFFRMRASGSDSTTSYTSLGYYSTPAGSGPAVDNNLGYWQLDNINASSQNIDSMELANPYKAVITQGTLITSGRNNTSFISTYKGLFHDVATAYDGVTIYPQTGTMTGTIRVYGYRNS